MGGGLLALFWTLRAAGLRNHLLPADRLPGLSYPSLWRDEEDLWAVSTAGIVPTGPKTLGIRMSLANPRDFTGTISADLK